MADQVQPRSEGEAIPDLHVDIIIPTLNEERTIGSLIEKISNLKLPIQISTLVIDGGSSDNTVEICKKANVRTIRQRGKGKGRAMREAVEYSVADIIVFIDGDGTYSTGDLDTLLDPLLSGEADMVVGSRLLGKREKGAISGFNSLGNKLFNKTINFAMKTSVTDSLSGYRAFYRKTFMELVLFSDSFEIEVEMTVEALAKGYRVLEVPISYGLRRGTKTKLNPLDDGIKIGRTLMFILMNVNPLKFFGIVSLAFFVVGLYPGILVLYEKISTGNITSMPSVVFASLLFMGSAISLVIGILSELVVASRRRLETIIMRTR
ncbi:MAG: glycosyltransferase [Thermoproteota archaeon]|nr:glycosyltransferase [Thermoproteota archaeon]